MKDEAPFGAGFGPMLSFYFTKPEKGVIVRGSSCILCEFVIFFRGQFINGQKRR